MLFTLGLPQVKSLHRRLAERAIEQLFKIFNHNRKIMSLQQGNMERCRHIARLLFFIRVMATACGVMRLQCNLSDYLSWCCCRRCCYCSLCLQLFMLQSGMRAVEASMVGQTDRETDRNRDDRRRMRKKQVVFLFIFDNCCGNNTFEFLL